MSFTSFLTAVGMGLGATLLMDVWNLFLKRGFGIPSLNYCFLGRWVRHMTSGKFVHASIGEAQPRAFECPVGYVAHYSIGVVLAVAFVALVQEDWLAQPSPTSAIAFGIATVVFPFLVMQPSLGLGIASSRTPRPSRARLKSLATHTVFGAGLYLAALAARLLAAP